MRYQAGGGGGGGGGKRRRRRTAVCSHDVLTGRGRGAGGGGGLLTRRGEGRPINGRWDVSFLSFVDVTCIVATGKPCMRATRPMQILNKDILVSYG